MDTSALEAVTTHLTRPISIGPVVLTVGELTIVALVGSAIVATLAIALVLRLTRRF
jgi:hypothetical protein